MNYRVHYLYDIYLYLWLNQNDFSLNFDLEKMDPYAELGVEPKASKEEIVNAYKEKLEGFIPDSETRSKVGKLNAAFMKGILFSGCPVEIKEEDSQAIIDYVNQNYGNPSVAEIPQLVRILKSLGCHAHYLLEAEQNIEGFLAIARRFLDTPLRKIPCSLDIFSEYGFIRKMPTGAGIDWKFNLLSLRGSELDPLPLFEQAIEHIQSQAPEKEFSLFTMDDHSNEGPFWRYWRKVWKVCFARPEQLQRWADMYGLELDPTNREQKSLSTQIFINYLL